MQLAAAVGRVAQQPRRGQLGRKGLAVGNREHHRPGRNGCPDRDPPRRKFETIDDLIAVMCENLSILSAMVDQAEGTDRYLKTLKAYSRFIPHLSSLLRTKRALGDPADDVLDIINQAVDQVVEEQGWTIFESFNR